jgi:integrase/recombinase XerD
MTTIDTYITEYMAGRVATGSYGAKSKRVVEPRLRSLAAHHGNRPLTQLTRRAIESWLATLGHLAQNSRAAYLASARQFTAWMVAERIITADPCATIPPMPRTRPLPRALDAHQVRAVLDAATTDRDRTIVWLMVGIGLRRMEVAALRWEDYNERDRLLIVRGKGDKERVLPVPAEVAACLARVRTATTGAIIRGPRGRALTAEVVGSILTHLMWESGVKHARYDGRSGHALRHTAASDVLDQCGDLRVVQELLGHEHLSTTSIYLRRVSAAAMRSAVEGRHYDP